MSSTKSPGNPYAQILLATQLNRRVLRPGATPTARELLTSLLRTAESITALLLETKSVTPAAFAQNPLALYAVVCQLDRVRCEIEGIYTLHPRFAASHPLPSLGDAKLLRDTIAHAQITGDSLAVWDVLNALLPVLLEQLPSALNSFTESVPGSVGASQL